MERLLIVSAGTQFAQELRVCAASLGMDTITCASIQDVYQYIQSGERADIVVVGDNLLVGTNLTDVCSTLMKNGYHDNLFCVLNNDAFTSYLNNSDIRYAFEREISPAELLDMIHESMEINIQKTQRISYSHESQDRMSRSGGMTQSYMPKTQTYSNSSYNTPAAGRNTYQSAPSSLGNHQRGFRPIMITINSPKGGVGKTSLSIELSTILADRASKLDFNPNSGLQKSKKLSVCLVDMNASFDTMASCLAFVRDRPSYPTVTDWVSKIEEKVYESMEPFEREELRADVNHDFTPYIHENEIRFTREEAFKLLVHDEQTGLYVLPSVALPFDVEYVKPEYIRIILNNIRQMFDIVIVDTGNNISFFTVEALRAADEVFLVTAPTLGSTTVVGKLTKNIDRLRLEREKLNLIVNYPNGANSELDPQSIAQTLGLPLVSVLPFETGIRESHEHGIPYGVNNPKSEYAHEVTKLAHQICPLWNVKTAAPAKKKKKKGGFLSWLFGD